MGNYKYFEGFAEFVKNDSPALAEQPLDELWRTLGRSYYEEVFRRNNLSAGRRRDGFGDILIKTVSGEFNLTFLYWLESHAYLDAWSTFAEAKRSLITVYENDYTQDWTSIDVLMHTVSENVAALQAHPKFLEVAMKEGYVPVAYVASDVTETEPVQIERTCYVVERMEYNPGEDYKMIVLSTSEDDAVKFARSKSKDFEKDERKNFLVHVFAQNADAVVYTFTDLK